MEPDDLDLVFTGEVIYWRGPSPYFFVVAPPDVSAAIRSVSAAVTYGWGAIPVHVDLGEHAFRTSLFPKDGRYLVPIRKSIRLAEGVGEGDQVTVRLHIGV